MASEEPRRRPAKEGAADGDPIVTPAEPVKEVKEVPEKQAPPTWTVSVTEGSCWLALAFATGMVVGIAVVKFLA